MDRPAPPCLSRVQSSTARDFIGGVLARELADQLLPRLPVGLIVIDGAFITVGLRLRFWTGGAFEQVADRVGKAVPESGDRGAVAR
jgi:hypothetical protein